MQASTRRANLSHAQQSKLRADDRRREILREENVKRLTAEKLLEANMASEERVENKRFLCRLQLEARERDMDQALFQENEARLLKEQQLEQEERLAKELQRMKMEKLRDEKFRQQIRENSVELRELEAKLKAGYMNRERAAQLAEKHLLEVDEQNREAEIAKTMRENHNKALEAQTAKERERYDESVRHQEQLEKQLLEQEKKKQDAYEEFLKEKLMIDEIVRKIYEEDQRELEKKLGKQRATQRYITEFKKKRDE
ncbi:meiosis-specific nuclear structural 1-like, partial [Paramuricea clavata]